MNAGIFETEHFEGAYPVIRLFDVPENKIFIFTTQITYQRFADLFGNRITNYSWIIKKERETLTMFLFRVRRELKKNRIDLLYCNTVSNNHLLYALMIASLKKTRVVLTVHDINCLFNSSPFPGFKNIVRHAGKKMLLKNVKEYNVVSSTMIPYLKTCLIRSDDIIHNIPGSIYQGKNITPEKKTLQIVIPGSIDKKRRNYEEVLRLIEILNLLALPVHIVILGGVTDEYGNDIIDRLKKQKDSSCTITYFETAHIDQKIFDQCMDESHFVFIPSVVETAICENIPETYGITKSSGNIFDVIKHGKPFMVPARLAIPSPLENCCFKYSQLQQLANFLSIIIKEDNYLQWSEKAAACCAYYSIENIRQANLSLFQVP